MALRLSSASTEYLRITSGTVIDYKQDYTIMVWWRTPTPTDNQVVMAVERSDDSAFDCWFVNPSSKFSIYTGSTLDNGTTTLSGDTWYHLTMLRTGSSMRGYLNAVLEVEGTKSQAGSSDSDWLTIGVYNAGNSAPSNARFSACKAWQRALSVAEIASEMRSLRVVSPLSLYGWWPFASGNDTLRPKDWSFKAHDFTEYNTPTTEADPPIGWGERGPWVGPPSGGTAYTLTAASGDFTLTGTAIDIDADRKLPVTSGTFTLTGTDVDLDADRKLAAASGAFTLTGTDIDLDADRRLVAASGTFTLTGDSVGIARGRTMVAASGTFTLTGTDADIDADRRLVAGSGTFTLTGTDVTLTYGSSSDYTLSAASGTFTLTGQDAALTLDQAGGTFVVTSGTWDDGSTVSISAGTIVRFAISGPSANAPSVRLTVRCRH